MTKATCSNWQKQRSRNSQPCDPLKVALATVFPAMKASLERACTAGARAEAAARDGDDVDENAERVAAKEALQQAIRCNYWAVRYGSPFPQFLSRVLQPVDLRGDA